MKINLHFKLLFTFLLFLLTNSGFGQEVIFSENMGERTSTGTLSIANNIFQNTNLVFSGDADVRNNTNSNYSGASGNNNVMINADGENFEISNINTLNYSNIVLSLGQRKGANAANNELLIQVSSDGINYSQLNYSRTTGSGTSNWILINPTGVIPSTQNLRIKFVGTNSTEWRIDDIKLTGILVPTTAPVLTTPDGISGTYGVLINQSVTGQHISSSTTWTRTGSMPSGVTFTNGVFGSYPTEIGAFTSFVKAKNEDLESNEVIVNFDISKADQTFGLPTVPNKFVDDANVTLPTKTKHLTNSTLEANNITYTSSNTAVVEIVNGNQLDFLSAGTATLKVSNSGNRNYLPLTQRSFNVIVNESSPSVCFEENFDDADKGSNTSTSGSGNDRWAPILGAKRNI